MRTIATFAIGFALAASPAFAQTDPSKLSAVAKRVEELVEQGFYKQVDFPTLSGDVTDRAIDDALADLKVSHTRRVLPATVDYFEVLDIYKRSLRREVRRLFGGGDTVAYQGIGIATRAAPLAHFIADVYPGTPAERAGLLRGDEIIAVDGKPFHEIESFKNRPAEKGKITIRRATNGPTMDVEVLITTVQPEFVFRTATMESMRILDEGNRKIGYVRLWTMHDDDVHRGVENALGSGKLKDADVLVIDLRGRWGGYVGRLVDVFNPGVQVEFVERNGDTGFSPLRWRKPVVAIIDEGSRSAMEILAFTMKKSGAQLVGVTTAGAVLSANAYMLPDDSLLMVAARDVITDGERLEGVGVSPDIEVANPLPYSAGADPQLDAAMASARQLLAAPDH